MQSTERIAAADADQRRRAVGFLAETDLAVAGEVATVALPGGRGGGASARAWAVVDRRRPLVWDANYVWAATTGGASAADLVRAADRVLGSLGLSHRLVVVADPDDGRRLAAGFAELGWRTAAHLVMVHRHPQMLAEAGAARETTRAHLLPARRADLIAAPWGDPDVAEQILDRDAQIDGVAHGRHFAASVRGVVASSCQLLTRAGIAQVEDVGTVERFRNRGLARAVVSMATAAARRDSDLVFLCADAEDWPQRLYGRLGYEPVGLLHRFCPVLPGHVAYATGPAPG